MDDKSFTDTIYQNLVDRLKTGDLNRTHFIVLWPGGQLGQSFKIWCLVLVPSFGSMPGSIIPSL